jgi:hypothetical protein
LKALLSPSALQTTVRCRVAAHELLRGSAESIAQWRRQPISLGTEKLPASFLKHAEDATVAAVTAVVAAVERQGWRERSFADWGVIAAPNLFGRITNAQAIERFRTEGAWGISPHLIPHQSLHAMSGTVSQALKIYGPNFGVSGGPNASLDAFLIAAAMLADGSLPGLWLLMTGYESEWIPAPGGRPNPAPNCLACALALTPTEVGTAGLHLAIGQAASGADLTIFPEFQLGAFAEEWTNAAQAPRWRLSDTCWLEFDAVLPKSPCENPLQLANFSVVSCVTRGENTI